MPLAPLHADRLCGANWRFGELGRAPWASGLAFLSDGRIDGYQNPHEARWQILDGRLEIFSAGGELTWRFIVTRESDGVLELEGTFLLNDSFTGVGSLQEIAAPAVAAEATSGSTLAVLVVGYGAPKILDRLAAFFDGLPIRLFAHIDAKKELTKYTGLMRNPGKITFIENRVPVFWGGFSMVAAELALLRAALADPAIANVVLISDDTAPLLPSAEIYQALREAPDRIASAGNGWREGWYRGFFYPDCTYGSLRGDVMHESRQFTPADFAMITRLEALRARGKKPIKSVQFCRQWWALSRGKLETMLQFIDADEHFVESFRFSLFSDETFFPTAFKICFPDDKPLDVPTYADFATVPRHPNPWIYQSAAEVAKAKVPDDALFIRKVSPEKPEIIDELIMGWTPKLEAVRLVIWDLDETFWRGTLTEGGITYVQDHHDIVVALAKRGIVSSICSKNDLAPVKQLLIEKGLWDYFVFPSVNWEAKGPRVAALVEAAQLRAPTVLFIDDNALNLNEVLHFVPGIQVSKETIIPGLLKNALLKGKDDTELTRLAQYKLLEARQEAQQSSGDNISFLHASQIRVTIEHDVDAHLDRAIELINRTNQLNFTKLRLPEDAEKARGELRHLLNQYDIQAGLVHVQDRFGDHGFTGVYVIRTVESRARLVHFCFSCRILGMGVERWLYERLGRPDLTVVGEVLTDLFAADAPPDWINTQPGENAAEERLTGRILVRGGCAMGSTAHYLTLNADEVVGEFNIVHGGKHARRDHSVFLRYALDGISEAQTAAAVRMGYVTEDFASALAEDPGGFDVCVFSFMNDARFALYKHPASGLRAPFFELFPDPAANLLPLKLIDVKPFREAPEMLELVRGMRNESYQFEGVSATAFRDNLTAILARIPDRVTLILLLDPEDYIDDNGATCVLHHFKKFNDATREVTAGRANVHLLNVLDFVEQPDERINADHFNRMVYFRFYQKIAEILRARRARTELFIDHNALNRSELLEFSPGILVGDQAVIPALLANPSLKGTEDSGLSRLEQDRILEVPHETPAARGEHAAFLHASDIRVTIEHNIETELDRAVELINRTNQLNFTKQRLPEDLATARAELRALLNQPAIKAGLVHVRDRYGDYGYTGVYVISTAQKEARYVHYCFSRRVQGMEVETWLHDRLGRPNLTVVGEVLTDLLAEHPPIEWINAADRESGLQEIKSEGANLIHVPEME